MRRAVLVIAAAILLASPAGADELFELAKKLANPLADLATAPSLYNWDQKLGTDEQGTSNYVRFQPVLPLHVNDDWNVITRLYMPVIEQQDVSPGSGTQTGLADVNLSFFLFRRGWRLRATSHWVLAPSSAFPPANPRSARRSGAWVRRLRLCGSRDRGPSAC